MKDFQISDCKNKVSIRKIQDSDFDYELILKWYKNPSVTECFKPIVETKEKAISG